MNPVAQFEIAAKFRAQPGDFLQSFQSDLPCPVSVEKIFRFRRRANHLYKLALSCPAEGRWPSSRTLGQDAVDAAASSANVIAGRVFP